MAGKRKRSHGAEAAQPKAQQHKAQQSKAQLKAAGKNKRQKASAASGKGAESAPVAAVANSNWLALKAKIQQRDSKFRAGDERKRDLDVKAQRQRAKEQKLARRKQAKSAEWVDNSTIVAMDCEMVGVGLSGKTSVLARCSIVDFDGRVLYDKHVRPVEKVTDFRTHVSGIRARSLKKAIPFAQCIKEVGKLLEGKIVVGHALKNDFSALMFTPPKNMIRDTAHYRPYMRRKMNGTKLYPKSLKHLAEEFLGLEIQGGEHDSVEDARATLELYKREQYAWEKYLRTNKNAGTLAGVAPPAPKSAEEDAKAKQKQEIAKALGESDDDEDDDFGVGSGGGASKQHAMVIPDSKELAIMEYGE